MGSAMMELGTKLGASPRRGAPLASARSADGARKGIRWERPVCGGESAAPVGAPGFERARSRQASGSAPGELLRQPGGSKSRMRIRSTDLRINLPKQCLPRVTWGLDGSSSDDCLPLAASAVRLSVRRPRSWFSDTARGHRCRPDQVQLFLAVSEVYFRNLRVGFTLSTPEGCAESVSRASGIWGLFSACRK